MASTVVASSPSAKSNGTQNAMKMDGIGQADMGAATVCATSSTSHLTTGSIVSAVDPFPKNGDDKASELVETDNIPSGKLVAANNNGGKEMADTNADTAPELSLNAPAKARIAPSSRESRTRRAVGTTSPPPAEEPVKDIDVESGGENGKDPDLDLVLDDDDSVDRELRELLGDDGLADIRIDDGDEEVDRLLGVNAETSKKATVDGVIAPPKVGVDKSHQRCCFGHVRRPYRIGGITVVLPGLYERHGFGSIGPHWLGTLCTAALLYAASYFYIYHAFLIGPVSGLICVGFTIQCSITLAMVAFRDPGVITPEKQQRESHARGEDGEYAGLPRDGRDLSDWRYCDLCSVYQPPAAAHCPDCNICIDGYDHHCPWMGQCIGKANMKAFMSFNISWLLYLIYALVWVSFSPAAKRLAMHSAGKADGVDEVDGMDKGNHESMDGT